MTTTTTTFPTTEDRSLDPPSGAPRAQDVRRLAERVADGAHALADRAAEQLAPAAERLRSRADEAGKALHARADELGAMQERLADESRATVRDHPLTWVAAAFVAGMVIGLLSRRD